MAKKRGNPDGTNPTGHQLNRTRAKAEQLGEAFGIDAVYDDAERLLREQSLDFVDIITDPGTHERFVKLVADHGLPMIC